MQASKLATIAVAVLIAGCALRPEWQHLAKSENLESSFVETARFRHRVLSNNVSGDVLHIYVEGDGTPWTGENRVAIDPTPSNPVMLRLMIDADHPAAYLGRPCYFGLATSRGCSSRIWTFDRYGQAVVDSMCEAANALARDARAVILVGYSGGGTIVVRMAGCTRRVTAVTTIAGNLDPAAWTAHHGFSPLTSDVDARYVPAPGVAETHWQCALDRNVPPEITDAYFETRPSAARHIVDHCTHATGWEAYAPVILSGTLPESD